MIVLWNSAEMTVQLTLIDGDKRTDYEWAAEQRMRPVLLIFRALVYFAVQGVSLV